jgi:PPOX class probable F420-dependent enzyme
MAEADLRALLEGNRRGVLLSIQDDGRPHAANILYVFDDEGRLMISTPGGSVKAQNLARDGRTSVHVSRDDFWAFVVAEGNAELTAPTTSPGDSTSDLLVDYYRRAQGEHSDWDEYRQAMVDEGRVVVRITVERLYGMACPDPRNR